MSAPIGRTMLLSSVFAAFLYVGTGGALEIAHLHINFSNSVPLGLYRETSELPGSYAGICLPTDTLTQAVHTGLAMDSGTCPGGVEPILKPVFVAAPAHPIAFGQDGFSVDGKLLPNTAPSHAQRRACRSRTSHSVSTEPDSGPSVISIPAASILATSVRSSPARFCSMLNHS